jgi:cytochrome b pre-mRNA-processing protein 3
MPLRRLLDRRRRERIAHDLYSGIIVQSRRPDFYVSREVPDTLDGRFDLIVLHAFLVMRRLKRIDGPQGEEARAISQALFDLMFDDMDQNLRELGVGDMSVGKRIKQMARAFYGRVAAYEDALAEAEPAALTAALARNLYGTLDEPSSMASLEAMAAYLRRQDRGLEEQSDGAVLEGRIAFIGPENAHVS